MRLIRADQLGRLHTSHERHRYIHLSNTNDVSILRQTVSHAYEDDIKGPIPLHTGSEGVHRKRPILRDLDCVPVLFEDLYGQLLVH